MPVTTYPKILLRGQLFVSKAGSRSQKRNSSTVTYSDRTYCDKVCFGKFLTIDNKECPEKTLHVALVSSTNVDSCTFLNQVDFPEEIDTYKL